jgi:hypothetical protein
MPDGPSGAQHCATQSRRVGGGKASQAEAKPPKSRRRADDLVAQIIANL